MSLNAILLFVHVLGAMGYAAATLISLFGLLGLRRVLRVEQARPLLGMLELTGPLSGISLFLIIVAGLYLAFAVWGWRVGWTPVALGTVILLMLPIGAVMGIRRHAIAVNANELPDGPLPDSLKQRIHDPLLNSSVVMLNALLLGIILLMTIKPAFVDSLIVMGGVIILGLAFSLPLWRTEQRAGKAVKSTEGQ